MMSYINETDFVIENKQLVYPEIVTDGLQLYYDAKGKRDTDYHRDTMLDMSGNKNHGKLHNFAYEKHSGYKDGLVFDYIDDKLVRPRLNLKPDDFTFMLNGNIISFSPDGTVKRVQDGEVIESKGFNMIRDGNFFNKTKWWQLSNLKLISKENGIGKFEITSSETAFIHQAINGDNFSENDLIYTSLESHIPHSATVKYIRWFDYKNIVLTGSSSDSLTRWSGIFRTGAPHPDYGATIRHHAQLSPGTRIELGRYIFVNLTRAFGAGNEPTKEQMDEIINRFGFIPNAQDLIDRLEYKGNDLGDMENIIDGLYKTDVLSGEEIYTDKADDNSVVHVNIDGKSVSGGNGKNIATLSNVRENNTNSFSVIKSEEWSYELYHTYRLTALSSDLKYLRWNEPWKEGVRYTASMYVYDPYQRVNYITAFHNEAQPTSEEENIYDLGEGWYRYCVTFTSRISGRPSHGILLYLHGSTPVGETVWVTGLQLEIGNVATSYEMPAPTPDHPIEIHSLNDFDVVSSVGKRNLIPKYTSQKWSHHNTTEVSEYQLIFPPGNGGNSILFLDIEPNVNYTVTFRSENARYYIYEVINGELGNIIRVSTNNDTYTFNSGNLTQIRISINTYSGNIDLQKVISVLKLEKNSRITEWTPAPEDITENDNHPLIDKFNLLLDEPLRSVGDVKDRLFRDSDGLWKLERKIAEYTPESFPGILGIAQGLLRVYTGAGSYLAPSTDRTAEFSSTHFPYLRGAGIERVNNGDGGGNKEVFIWIDTEKLSTPDLSGANKWLEEQKAKNTPLKILYERGTFDIEILPQTLQDKLNNLRSFEDSNYVYTVLPNENNYLSENLKPTLHAKFLYNNWYKEDRVINNLMIYNRALTNEEMLQNYKTIKRRWGM